MRLPDRARSQIAEITGALGKDGEVLPSLRELQRGGALRLLQRLPRDLQRVSAPVGKGRQAEPALLELVVDPMGRLAQLPFERLEVLTDG